MKRLFLVGALLMPATVAAQDTTVTPTPPRVQVDFSPATSETKTHEAAAMTMAPVAAPQGQPRSSGRRRPSMVGYVNDATIGDQLRIRFDASFEITAPDRAEFFYGKCGCYRGLPAGHAALDPDAPGPGPGIATDINSTTFMVQGEYALSDRLSFYGELPMRSVKPQAFVSGSGSFPNATGLSDIRAGVKLGLVAATSQAVTLQLQMDAPTGDAGKGLGTNHWSFAPTLLYYQQAGERVAVESQFGAVLPLDGSAGIPTNSPDKFAGTVVTYGVGASVDLAPDAHVSVAPVVELFGWRVLSGFQTSTFGPADGTNIVNLKIGARISVGSVHSVYIGYGRGLTDAKWYHDILRFEYRVGF